jgi:hypothetical protein
MSRHEPSASLARSASTLLPGAEAISLPPARNEKAGSTASAAFTKASVRKMYCPPGRDEKLFWDKECRGLGIRALASGRRSWIFQYRDEHKRTRRIVLGDLSSVEEALPVLFNLIEHEGLVLGGSSAINIVGTMRLARDLGPGKTIVTILADGGQRYQSKLFNPEFLRKKNLPTPRWME